MYPYSGESGVFLIQALKSQVWVEESTDLSPYPRPDGIRTRMGDPRGMVPLGHAFASMEEEPMPWGHSEYWKTSRAPGGVHRRVLHHFTTYPTVATDPMVEENSIQKAHARHYKASSARTLVQNTATGREVELEMKFRPGSSDAACGA